MNDIPKIQNQEEHIKQLAAQRQLYSEAKQTMGWQVFFAFITALMTFVIALRPAYQEWSMLIVLMVILLDVLALEPRQRKLTQQAAKIQGEFDSEVFQWKGFEETPREINLINEEARKHQKRDPGFSKLKDWYPIAVGTIPLIPARIVCQLSNVWWDAQFVIDMQDLFTFCWPSSLQRLQLLASHWA